MLGIFWYVDQYGRPSKFLGKRGGTVSFWVSACHKSTDSDREDSVAQARKLLEHPRMCHHVSFKASYVLDLYIQDVYVFL